MTGDICWLGEEGGNNFKLFASLTSICEVKQTSWNGKEWGGGGGSIETETPWRNFTIFTNFSYLYLQGYLHICF